MNIWEDLTMACPQCGAASNEKCRGVNTVTPRIAIHENRDAANQSEYARRAALYPEMLAALKETLAYLPAYKNPKMKIEALIAKCEGKNE